MISRKILTIVFKQRGGNIAFKHVIMKDLLSEIKNNSEIFEINQYNTRQEAGLKENCNIALHNKKIYVVRSNFNNGIFLDKREAIAYKNLYKDKNAVMDTAMNEKSVYNLLGNRKISVDKLKEAYEIRAVSCFQNGKITDNGINLFRELIRETKTSKDVLIASLASSSFFEKSRKRILNILNEKEFQTVQNQSTQVQSTKPIQIQPTKSTQLSGKIKKRSKPNPTRRAREREKRELEAVNAILKSPLDNVSESLKSVEILKVAPSKGKTVNVELKNLEIGQKIEALSIAAKEVAVTVASEPLTSESALPVRKVQDSDVRVGDVKRKSRKFFIETIASKTNMNPAISIYCDGSYNKSGGFYGFLVYKGDEIVAKKTGIVFDGIFGNSSSGAENMSIIQALEWAYSNEINEVEIFYDARDNIFPFMTSRNLTGIQQRYKQIVERFLDVLDVRFTYVEKDNSLNHQRHNQVNNLIYYKRLVV